MRRFLFNVNHINVWLDIPSKKQAGLINKKVLRVSNTELIGKEDVYE